MAHSENGALVVEDITSKSGSYRRDSVEPRMNTEPKVCCCLHGAK